MTRVSPIEAHALMRDAGYVYLDVRSVPEFDAGHPEGAFNVPWLEATSGGLLENAEFVAQISAVFPRDAKLLIGCKAVSRSEQAAQALIAAGFCDVVIQRAGMDGVVDPFGRVKDPGWRASGLPVALEARAGHAHAALAMHSDSSDR
jgi:rhodanese-related sulfurtransferase